MKVTKKSVVIGGSAVFGGLIASLVIALSLFAPATNVMAVPGQGGGSGCEGDVKVEGESAYIEAPEGQGILEICIKAGQDIITVPCGEDVECYDIEWHYEGDCYYAHSVTVSGGGTSRYCKEISHVAATFTDHCEGPIS